MTDPMKIRTPESRQAEAKKILANRPRRGKPGEGPEARVKPKVLTPEERQMAAAMATQDAAKERQDAAAAAKKAKEDAKKAKADEGTEPKAD